MSALSSVMEALQVVSARGLTESKAAQSYSSLHTILTVLSEHPMDDKCIDDATKAFTACITHAEKLCGMASDSAKCLGLAALGTSMQNCPRKLFLTKIPDVWHRVNTLARGNSAEASEAASDTLVQMLKRLHTFMAAQGVKTIAAQPVAQIVLTALQLLRSGPALIQCGLSLTEAVLECMPQAARSQVQAASVAIHTIMADLQLSLDVRLRAARVLAALPASQNTPDAYSQHLQGLLSALHASLSTIPAPVTDAQASRAAREALGDKLQGSWSGCMMVPPAAAAHHVPPQQRLDAIAVLMECLIETCSRRHVPPVLVPVSPAILLVSRLVAQRPLHVPFSEEQFTAPERAQLLLSGTPLLKAGLKILQLLMLNREQLQQMAAALSRLLSELLLDASTPNRLPEDVRSDLYATVSTAMRAFKPQDTQPMLETLVPCAWAEFATPEDPSSKAAAQTTGALKVATGGSVAGTEAKASGTGSGRRGSRRKRKAGEDGELAGSFGETLDRVNGAVEHAHRPTNIHHVTNAQVGVLRCIEAMHDIVSGSLAPQLQVDVDVFTVSVLESCHWSRHLVLTDPRIHDVKGVAAVKQAATAAVAAMCRSGFRRNGQVPMVERITALLQQQPCDPAVEAEENAALQALATAAALSAARQSAQTALNASTPGSNTTANNIKNKGSESGAGVATGVATAQTLKFAQTSACGAVAHMHGKAPPLEPEFENMLSMRVAAVMHRGLQLACGLGATGDPQNNAIGGQLPEAPGEPGYDADAVMEGSGGEGSGGDGVPEQILAPGGARMHVEKGAEQGQVRLGMPQPQQAMYTRGSGQVVPGSGASTRGVRDDVAQGQASKGTKAQPDACIAAPSRAQVNTGSSAVLRSSHVVEAPQSEARASGGHVVGVTSAASQLSGARTGSRIADVNRAENGRSIVATAGGERKNGGEGPVTGRTRDVSVPVGSVAVGEKGLVDASIDVVGMDVSGEEDVAGGDDSDAIPEIDSGPSEEDGQDGEEEAE